MKLSNQEHYINDKRPARFYYLEYFRKVQELEQEELNIKSNKLKSITTDDMNTIKKNKSAFNSRSNSLYTINPDDVVRFQLLGAPILSGAIKISRSPSPSTPIELAASSSNSKYVFKPIIDNNNTTTTSNLPIIFEDRSSKTEGLSSERSSSPLIFADALPNYAIHQNLNLNIHIKYFQMILKVIKV